MYKKQSSQNQKRGYQVWEDGNNFGAQVNSKKTKIINKITLFVKKTIGLAMIFAPAYYYNDASNYIMNIGKSISANSFSEIFMLLIYLSGVILWYLIGFNLSFSKKN